MKNQGIVFWEKELKDWKKSKLSKLVFCEQRGYPQHRFNYWLRKINKGGDKVKVQTLDFENQSDQVDLVEIKVPPVENLINSNSKVLKITTSYGCTLEVPL